MISLTTAQRLYAAADVAGALQRAALSETALGRRAFLFEAAAAQRPAHRRRYAAASHFCALGAIGLGAGRLSTPVLAFGAAAMGRYPYAAAEVMFGRGRVAQEPFVICTPTSHREIHAVSVFHLYDTVTAAGVLGAGLEVLPAQMARIFALRDAPRAASACLLAATLGRCVLQPVRIALSVVELCLLLVCAGVATAVMLTVAWAMRVLCQAPYRASPIEMALGPCGPLTSFGTLAPPGRPAIAVPFSDDLGRLQMWHTRGAEAHQEIRERLQMSFARFQMQPGDGAAGMLPTAEAARVADGMATDLRAYCRRCPDDAAYRGGIFALQAFMDLSYEEAQWRPPCDAGKGGVYGGGSMPPGPSISG